MGLNRKPDLVKKNSREAPLNKREMRLFIRLFTGSLILHTDSLTWCEGLSGDEVEELGKLQMIAAAKMLGENESFSTTEEILTHLKSLRKPCP